MLGAMLGSSSQSVAVPEAPFIGQTSYLLMINGGHYPRDPALQLARGSHRINHWKIEVPWDDYRGSEWVTPEEYRSFIESLVGIFWQTREQPAPQFWVEHSPTNIRYSRALDQVFPDAHFVHIYRDGRGVAASVLPMDWGATDTLEAANHWLGDIAFGLVAEQAIPGERFHSVQFEHLVQDPGTVLSGLCEAIGIPFDPNMVLGDKFDVPAYNDQQHLLVGQHPDPGRVDAWKTTLSPRQIEVFESRAGPMLVHLGYEPQQRGVIRMPGLLERMRADIARICKRELWYRIRNRKRRRKI